MLRRPLSRSLDRGSGCSGSGGATRDADDDGGGGDLSRSYEAALLVGALIWLFSGAVNTRVRSYCGWHFEMERF